MTERKAVVIVDGTLKELPAGDTLAGATQLGVPTYIQQTEPPGPSVWYKTDISGTVIDILTVT